ncbi:MAG: ROK family transcriptional regulator [Pseudomonadota bacterium]
MKYDRGTLGGEQTGLRAYNKRTILNLIRQSGALPKAEIARLTGLSGQSVSVIVNGLLKEKLVRKEGKIRGKVGQPTTPIALNEDGAFSVGVKIGRRSLEVMLVNFLGQRVEHSQVFYDAPRVSEVRKLLKNELSRVLDGVDHATHDRIVGVGVAMPSLLHEWADVMGLATADLVDWRGLDVASLVSDIARMPVEIYNDATAACAAEMVLGTSMTKSSAFYIFIGTFAGGGIVLDRRLFTGPQGNAGAIGPIPVPTRGGGQEQLLANGSLFTLDRTLVSEGIPLEGSIADRVRDPRAAGPLRSWRERASEVIAFAIASAVSVIDFEEIVIDAMLHPPDVQAIVDDVRLALRQIDLTGTSPTVVKPGTIGPAARVSGAAVLPLVRQFSPDQMLLLKSPMASAS